MPADPTSGPEAPPADELAAAEATLRVLQQVVHGIATDDLTKPTPCREFDVAALTDHLLNSITSIGSVAGAESPQRDPPTRWNASSSPPPARPSTPGTGAGWTAPSRSGTPRHRRV